MTKKVRDQTRQFRGPRQNALLWDHDHPYESSLLARSVKGNVNAT